MVNPREYMQSRIQQAIEKQQGSGGSVSPALRYLEKKYSPPKSSIIIPDRGSPSYKPPSRGTIQKSPSSPVRVVPESEQPSQVITPEQYKRERIAQQRNKFKSTIESMVRSSRFRSAPEDTRFYQGDQEITREQALQQESQFRMQVRNQPSLKPVPSGYYTIQKTRSPEGVTYSFKQTPEQARKTVLERGRAEYQKQSDIQRFSRALFAGATQFPTLVYETVASPFTGKTQQQIKEDIALSEISTFERLKTKRDPVEFVVRDVALSPAMIEVGVTAASLGLARAAAPAFRGAVRAGARGYRAVSSFVPEESAVARILSKGAVKLSGREPVERALKYTYKGYRWGSPFVQKTVPQRVVSKSFIGVKEVNKKFVLKTSGRVFLSPSEQRFAAKELARRIESGYKWSPFRKALVKKSKTQLVYDISKKEIGTPAVESSKLLKGGFRNIQKTSVPLVESQAKGMRVYTKTGKFVGYKQPELYQKPLSKKWISNYRKPFLTSKTAQQTLTPQIQLPKYITKTKSVTRGYGITRGMSVATESFSSPFLLGVSRVGSVLAQEKLLFQMQQPKTIQTSEQATIGISMQKPVISLKQQQAQVQLQEQIQPPRQQTISKGVTQTKAKAISVVPVSPVKTFPTVVPPVLFPNLKIYGRGRKGSGFGLYSKTKKFRSVKVTSPLKGLKL